MATTDEIPAPTAYPYHAAANILYAAASLVRSGWVQLMLAAGENKRPVAWDSPKACSWCAVGAIKRAGLDYDAVSTAAALREMKRTVRTRWVADWNNVPVRTKEQVADMMDMVASVLIAQSGTVANMVQTGKLQ